MIILIGATGMLNNTINSNQSALNSFIKILKIIIKEQELVHGEIQH
jgi:hypothetical protein